MVRDMQRHPTVRTALIQNHLNLRLNLNYYMEAYRSGHNEPDSKSEWMPEIVSKIVIINKFL